AMEAYEKLSTEAAASYAAGKRIAIVAEGDAGFYSSVHYVFEQLLAQGIAVQQVAGIPAFIASGALAGLHIVSQEERLMVIPGNTTAQELSDWLDAGLVVVIMKLSQCREAVKQCMAQYNDHTFHYFENVGTPREVYIRATKELIEKEFPYFSLMIIKKTM
ncbi:MAG TPA: precorrin-2 C(20)-methyltransferase, partial [Bacteroides graminisolvens]|nr:precorrin-2 C(20)-methyltransferase [Bacteroides graminisolvens]